MYANVQGRLVAKTRKTGFLSVSARMQTSRSDRIPISPSEVLNVISGGEPIVTDDPAENALQSFIILLLPPRSKARPGWSQHGALSPELTR